MTRPLIAKLGSSGVERFNAWVWITSGKGWVLSEFDGKWWPIDTASGFGGSVLTDAEVAQLVARFGSPEQPRPSMAIMERERAKMLEEATRDLE